MSGVEGSSWAGFSPSKCVDGLYFDNSVRLGISVALAVIASIAAYYCIANGLRIESHATTSLQYHGGRALTAVGASFGLAAVGNLIYGTCINCTIRGKQKNYGPDEAGLQVLITATAPVAAIALVCYGLLCRKAG